MQWIHYAVGLAFSSLVAHVFIYWLIRELWGRLTSGSSEFSYPVYPQMVGVMERLYYTAAWVLGEPQMIAVWLALKVAGRWGKWTDDQTISRKQVAGRDIYNVFLIGTGFSLAYGVTGGLVIDWLEDDRHTPAASAIILLVAVTIFLGIGPSSEIVQKISNGHVLPYYV